LDTKIMTLRFFLTLQLLCASLFAASGDPVQTAEDPSEVRHLFVAKLLLKRMNAVGLTPEQLRAFNRLSADLRARIDLKRAAAGITRDTIKKRDKIYSELKKSDLKGDALWIALQKKGGFTDAQRRVFQETSEIYRQFKADALKLLTKEQRSRLPKPGKKR